MVLLMVGVMVKPCCNIGLFSNISARTTERHKGANLAWLGFLMQELGAGCTVVSQDGDSKLRSRVLSGA